MVLFSENMERGYFSIELLETLLDNNKFTVAKENVRYSVWVGAANGNGLTLSQALRDAQEKLKEHTEEWIEKEKNNQEKVNERIERLNTIKSLLQEEK